MSKYATKWEPISRDEYYRLFKEYDSSDERLTVYSSYTNPDGDDGISFCPQMLTSWGTKEKELLYIRQDKDSREDIEWNWTCKKAVEWEEEP